jgi:hypothetical protein
MTYTLTEAMAMSDHLERIALHNRILDEEKAKSMTYTLTAHPNTIVRDEDGAFVPTDPDNVDYQEYLAWLDEGNEPTPYSPPEAKIDG